MTQYKELEELEEYLNEIGINDYMWDEFPLSFLELRKALKQVEQRAREEVIEAIINNGYATADKNYVSFDIRELKNLVTKQGNGTK